MKWIDSWTEYMPPTHEGAVLAVKLCVPYKNHDDRCPCEILLDYYALIQLDQSYIDEKMTWPLSICIPLYRYADSVLFPNMSYNEHPLSSNCSMRNKSLEDRMAYRKDVYKIMSKEYFSMTNVYEWARIDKKE